MPIGFRMRKLLICGLLATFSFAEDLGNDLQRLMQTRPNYEALKPIMKQMPQSPLDYFRKIKPYVPKNMADTFNQFLQYGEDREAKKGRLLTILVLTSSNKALDNFNHQAEVGFQHLASKGVKFQSAFVLQGLPKTPRELQQFIYKTAGLKKDSKDLLALIQKKAEQEGIDPKKYMETKAKQEGMNRDEYAKKFYYQYMASPDIDVNKIQSVFKIIPRLYKTYQIKQVPAYFIGLCYEVNDTDFDLDDCTFDDYAIGDGSFESFLKNLAIKDKKYDEIYTRYISPSN